MKKAYIIPSLKVVKLYSEMSLMAGSDGGSGGFVVDGEDKQNHDGGDISSTGENANDDDFTVN